MTENHLLRAGIVSVGRLRRFTRADLEKLPNIGPTQAQLILDAVNRLNRNPPEDALPFSSEGGRIMVPDQLNPLPVGRLRLPLATKNHLLRAGILFIGSLRRFTASDLEDLENMGPVHASRVLRALEDLARDPPEPAAPGLEPPAADRRRLTLAEEEPPPEWTRRFYVDGMPDLPRVSRSLLRENGVETLGDLIDWLRTDVAMVPGVGQRTAEKLQTKVESLLELGEHRVGQIVWDERYIPSLSKRVLVAVATAIDLGSEVKALVADMAERDQRMFLGRICFEQWPQPTLEEIGDQEGITRERVRQITRAREKLLRASKLRLPIGSSAVELVEHAGGMISTGELLTRVECEGQTMTKPQLMSLPSLAEMGLTPGIRHIPQVDCWISTGGERRWLESGLLHEALKDVRRRGRRGFRRTSACEVADIAESSPFSADQVVLALTPQSGSVELYLGYIIPLPVRDSTLVRSARKLLSISDEMSIDEIYRALHRHPRIQPSPLIVMKRLLELHGDFDVSQSVVRGTRSFARADVLSDSEVAFVHALEEAGGVLEYWEAVDAIEAAGFSRPMLSVLLSGVLVRRPAVGVYALRGPDIPRDLVRQKVQSRRETRSRTVISAGWLDPLTYEITYRVNRHTLDGVLALPSAFRPAYQRWRGVLPNGRDLRLKMRNGFLWSLQRWFKAEVEMGDHVIATFYPSEGKVEFDHVPGDRDD